MTARTGPLHWLDVTQACLRNGDDLVSDAMLLFEHERFPRALSIAVLATEEYGKAIHAVTVLNLGGSPEEVVAFDRAARIHKTKLEAGRIWAAVLNPSESFDPEFRERVLALVEQAAARKMDGFYVDRQPDGVGVPADITEAEAADSIAAARHLGSQIRDRVSALDSDEAASLLWEFGPEITRALAARAEELGATDIAVLAALQAMLPGLGVPLTDSVNDDARAVARVLPADNEPD
ncbi:AbiV family abortive infection protein [Cellulomonas sp. McL0617]|uniref:AbiV family abortive infection protein n=1 Tax=Cellulomonas sp. McL0617 TaxID=3415675 RepID=UPI003CFA6714